MNLMRPPPALREHGTASAKAHAHDESYLYMLLTLVFMGGGLWFLAPLALTAAAVLGRHGEWYRQPAAWFVLLALVAGIVSGAFASILVERVTA